MGNRCPYEGHSDDPYHHACMDCKDQVCGRRHLALHVAKALVEDGDALLARTSPANLDFLGIREGEYLVVEGDREAVVPVAPVLPGREAEAVIHLDEETMKNAGTALFRKVLVRRADPKAAEEVVLAPVEPLLIKPQRRTLLEDRLRGKVVLEGNTVDLPVSGDRRERFRVVETRPSGPLRIETSTRIRFTMPGEGEPDKGVVTYADIGGLGREIERIREIVELPLGFPELFDRLGVEAPKGILLHGPPGSGKTLIARAVAQETQANFYHLNGPEIMQSHYGESEEYLRSFFEKAQKNAPAIIFLDEIDAVAPQRAKTQGEVEKRVVAQLLALMDGLESRGQVVVIGATNIPNALDPALRRPGRFDREISIGVPSEAGRREILRIHSRRMPLSREVDLDEWARRTHGFVGADLKALCQEAAFQVLRRRKSEIESARKPLSPAFLEDLYVEPEDFEQAFKEVEPSAIREVHVELPQVGWDQVGGCAAAKRALEEAVIWPLRFPREFERLRMEPPKGILLTGPSGSGKTLIAQALARESGLNFISVKGPELLSKFVGESEERIREIFHKARMAAPCILFFDEIDSIAGNRGDLSDSGRVVSRMVSQLLTEMDGVGSMRGVIILGATSRPELLDPALLRPGRFEVQIALQLPNQEERREILAVHLQGKALAPGVDLEDLARKTAGWSGAQIEALCRGAAMEWLRESVGGEKLRQEAACVLEERHFQKAMKRV